MTVRPSVPAPARQQGVVLLEALIAILIFSLGILGLVGLQAGMVKGTSEAKYRAEASYVAQREIGRIWADPNNAASYSLGVAPGFRIDIKAKTAEPAQD